MGFPRSLDATKHLFLALALSVSVSCGTCDSTSTGGQVFSEDPPLTIGGERPAPVVIPRDYDPGVAHPLVIVLHGFGPYTGVIQSAFFGVADMVDEKDFVLVRRGSSSRPAARAASTRHFGPFATVATYSSSTKRAAARRSLPMLPPIGFFNTAAEG
jgi:poly(3-hydroxybutyrate) depolymerase